MRDQTFNFSEDDRTKGDRFNEDLEAEGDEWEALLDQRDAEMNQVPSVEVSHEEFLSHFSSRRLRQPGTVLHA